MAVGDLVSSSTTAEGDFPSRRDRTAPVQDRREFAGECGVSVTR